MTPNKHKSTSAVGFRGARHAKHRRSFQEHILRSKHKRSTSGVQTSRASQRSGFEGTEPIGYFPKREGVDNTSVASKTASDKEVSRDTFDTHAAIRSDITNGENSDGKHGVSSTNQILESQGVRAGATARGHALSLDFFIVLLYPAHCMPYRVVLKLRWFLARRLCKERRVCLSARRASSKSKIGSTQRGRS